MTGVLLVMSAGAGLLGVMLTHEVFLQLAAIFALQAIAVAIYEHKS